jgi:hypothetical protein
MQMIVCRTFDPYYVSDEKALQETLADAQRMYPQFVWELEHIAQAKQHVTVYIRGIRRKS